MLRSSFIRWTLTTQAGLRKSAFGPSARLSDSGFPSGMLAVDRPLWCMLLLVVR